MGDAELQMVDDALHGVVGLLPCGPQVFLHRTCQRRKDGLGRLPGVHCLPQVFRWWCGLFGVVPLDVGEGFLHGYHQSGRRYRGWRFLTIKITNFTRLTQNELNSALTLVKTSFINHQSGPGQPSKANLQHPHLALRLRTLRSISASS